MRLIKFAAYNGTDVFINPDHVVLVTKTDEEHFKYPSGTTAIFLVKGNVLLKAPLLDVIHKLRTNS
jgi:hypothetical protein